MERIPVRNDNNCRYFNDKYEALPEKGYTKFIEELLNNELITVLLNTDFNEYKKLHRAIKNHADKLLKEKKTHHANNAMELYDFVILATNTGMRVGELMNMRFCDVKIVEDLKLFCDV